MVKQTTSGERESEAQQRAKALADQEIFTPIQTQPNQFDMGEFIDNTFIVDELINTLQGNVIDSIKRKVISVDHIIPQKAVGWLVNRILPYTSKIFILSFLDDEDTIREMIYDFEVAITLDLMNCEKLGIDAKHRNFIKTLAVHMMIATIYRAKNGVTMKRILEQHEIKEVKSIQEGGTTNPKSPLAKLGFKI